MKSFNVVQSGKTMATIIAGTQNVAMVVALRHLAPHCKAEEVGVDGEKVTVRQQAGKEEINFSLISVDVWQ
ncbi:MAG: hypothetical protein AAB740_02330 [Patescibacteria group bacterium]